MNLIFFHFSFVYFIFIEIMNQSLTFDDTLKKEWQTRYNENEIKPIFKSTLHFIHQR